MQADAALCFEHLSLLLFLGTPWSIQAPLQPGGPWLGSSQWTVSRRDAPPASREAHSLWVTDQHRLGQGSAPVTSESPVKQDGEAFLSLGPWVLHGERLPHPTLPCPQAPLHHSGPACPALTKNEHASLTLGPWHTFMSICCIGGLPKALGKFQDFLSFLHPEISLTFLPFLFTSWYSLLFYNQNCFRNALPRRGILVWFLFPTPCHSSCFRSSDGFMRLC